MKKALIVTLIMVMGVFSLNLYAEKALEEENKIQMGILLDTSGSMDGLIEQAKTQLWKIVNEMALAKRNGVSPDLEVALYEYGKDSIPKQQGYLRMIVPLTTDLDKISEELFKLKTNGGEEYCGQVIKHAVENLGWANNNKILKVIFIAGNESFNQGKVDYKKSVKSAIEKGIIVNTIFCGNFQEGINTKWKEGADLADGKYINIDQNQKIVDIKSPQDEEIIKLGEDLNKTYIYYGSTGKDMKMRQEMQDTNAKSVGVGVFLDRSITKSKKQYKNTSWDIVDAQKEGEVKVEEMKENELPEEMKKMTKEERKKYIDDKQKEREAIQKKIEGLEKERRKYIEEEKKKISQNNTLDDAVIKAIKEQAEKKEFKFEK